MSGRRRWRIRVTRTKTDIKARLAAWWDATLAVNPSVRLYATCRRVRRP